MTDSGLLVAAPLRCEAVALRRRLSRGEVMRTGMGPARSARALPGLRARRPRAFAVAGLAGGLTEECVPGDVVVASELRCDGGTLTCPNTDPLVDALDTAGLRVRSGPIVCVDRLVHGAQRVRLADSGALAVDMESATLVSMAGGLPFAVVRVVVDTPKRGLLSLATITGGVIGLTVLAKVGPVLRSLVPVASHESVVPQTFPMTHPKEVRR